MMNFKNPFQQFLVGLYFVRPERIPDNILIGVFLGHDNIIHDPAHGILGDDTFGDIRPVVAGGKKNGKKKKGQMLH